MLQSIVYLDINDLRVSNKALSAVLSARLDHGKVRRVHRVSTSLQLGLATCLNIANCDVSFLRSNCKWQRYGNDPSNVIPREVGFGHNKTAFFDFFINFGFHQHFFYAVGVLS